MIDTVKHCPICGGPVEHISLNSVYCHHCQVKFYITIEYKLSSPVLMASGLTTVNGSRQACNSVLLML